MQDSDIWRAALAYMEQHGDKATIHAAMEADACLDARDLDGAATWRLVLRVIREIAEPEAARH